MTDNAPHFVSPRMLHYNAIDGAETWHVWQNFPRNQIFDNCYERTIRVLPSLMFIMVRGILVDVENLHVYKKEVEEELAGKIEELNKEVGRQFNALSPKACQAYFYGELGFKPYYKQNDQGEQTVTTDDKAMQRLVRKGCKAAKLVQDVRGLNKLLSNYVDVKYDTDNRFRSAYNPRGTINGRFSSSKTIFNTGFNAQNLDPAFKRFLIADPGMMLIEIDKRQAEWVCMAYITGDQAMIHAVESGQDIHVATASRMYDVPPELVLRDHKAVGSESDADSILEYRMADPILAEALRGGIAFPRAMSYRQAGKKSNHGLNYDEGYRTFALSNELPDNEGKRIVELYHKIYPGIRIWYKHVLQELTRTRMLVNCFGRPRTFLGQLDDTALKSAFAFLPQSTVVDGLNEGMIGIYNNVPPAELLAQVHDSVLFQVPCPILGQLPDIMPEIYRMASPDMTYNGRTFTIKTDMKVGKNWGKYHKERNPLGMREIKNNPTEASSEAFLKELQEIAREWETHEGLA